jgi:hypothetical protein
MGVIEVILVIWVISVVIPSVARERVIWVISVVIPSDAREQVI